MCAQMTDALLATNKFEICARAQGGKNAGHSVKTGDKCTVSPPKCLKGSLMKSQPTACTSCLRGL